MTTATQQINAHIKGELDKVLFGIDSLYEILTAAILGHGHLLITGSPGTGKTLLASALIEILGNNAGRLDCRNDTDIIGVVQALSGTTASDPDASVDKHSLLYLAGLNRLTPNTQSILLTVMEESRLSNHGISMTLHEDFRLLASYDPYCFDGTYPLIGALMDRFFVSVEMEHHSAAMERDILKSHGLSQTARRQRPGPPLTPLNRDLLGTAQKELQSVNVSDTVYDYIAEFIQAIRQQPDIATNPTHRCAFSLLLAARVLAVINDRDYLLPEDIDKVSRYCLAHRLVLTPDALLENKQLTDILRSIYENMVIPEHEAN